jgi:hypothetical protein
MSTTSGRHGVRLYFSILFKVESRPLRNLRVELVFEKLIRILWLRHVFILHVKWKNVQVTSVRL